MIPTKVSTEITEVLGSNAHRNFTKAVKFLRIDDDFDKFLTGIPESSTDEDKID
jgi:hypothetical protein